MYFSETIIVVESLLRRAYGQTIIYWKDIFMLIIMLLKIRKLKYLLLNPVPCPF